MEKLSKILRIDSNLAMQALNSSHERRRFSARMLAYNRFRTSFFWNMKFTKFLPFGSKLALTFDNFLSKGVSADIRINLSNQEKIYNLYCEGNSRLAEKYGLPLERFGYPLVGAVNNV